MCSRLQCVRPIRTCTYSFRAVPRVGIIGSLCTLVLRPLPQARWSKNLGWLTSQLVRQLFDTLRDTIATSMGFVAVPFFSLWFSAYKSVTRFLCLYATNSFVIVFGGVRKSSTRSSGTSNELSRLHTKGVQFTTWHQNRYGNCSWLFLTLSYVWPGCLLTAKLTFLRLFIAVQLRRTAVGFPAPCSPCCVRRP
jgi:hypothetical protein